MMDDIDISGLWKGTIESTWINPGTGTRVGPIEATFSVVQNDVDLSCTMRTLEMTSYSQRENLTFDKRLNEVILNYQYFSYPITSVRDRSPIHQGTMNFVLEVGMNRRLVGSYYTDRNTQGEIELNFISKNIQANQKEFTKDHPAKKQGLSPSQGVDSSTDRVDLLLIKGKVDQAIDLLLKRIRRSSLERLKKEVIVITAWWEDLKREETTSLISREEFRVGRNRIVRGVTTLNQEYKQSRLG